MTRDERADTTYMDIDGKTIADVDRWAYECFVSQLRSRAAYPELSEAQHLARHFLATLPRLEVRDKCPCREPGCHTYSFVEEPLASADIASMSFPKLPGWSSFDIHHLPDGTIVGIELVTDD